jgi:hydrogenase nickel incorporation protein HypA/HybF
MHELAITQSIVEIARKASNGRKVLSVTIEIGPLAGVVPEAVSFCFSACSHGTSLEGAMLKIISPEGQGHCLSCGSISTMEGLTDPCAHCGSYGLRVISGEELRVKELEVEEDVHNMRL